MKIDKNPFAKSVYGKSLRGTIGLSIVLAALVALAVLSASFPALGTEAVQNVTVAANVTAIKIVPQNGTYHAATVINYWNFTGQSGATVDNPTNSLGQVQDTAVNTSPVACLNNTNPSTTMTVTINAATFSPNLVSSEDFSNVTLGTNPTWYDLPFGSDKYYGSLNSTENKTLWLKVTLTGSGSATSTFNVTAEA
jgi:hypothetical protein